MKSTCNACQQPTDSECAWVIETAQQTYWDGRCLGRSGFTAKINDAIRFARFEDAEVVKHWLMPSFAFTLRSTQHMWVDSQEAGR